MRIAVFLPCAYVRHLVASLEDHDEICSADSWEMLETLIRVEPLSVVVFSPHADGTMDVSRACRLIRRFSSIPFVAYVPLDATFARGIAHMSNEGLQELVVLRENDTPARFRDVLTRVSSIREVTALLDALQPAFHHLPTILVQCLVDALRQPHKYPSAEAIAAAAGMTVSGLYRSFRTALLNSPKSFVIAAHTFRGYLYLQDAGFSVRDIAAKLGYTHPRIFAHQMECVFGERPSRIRYNLGMDDAVKQLVTWISPREGSQSVSIPDGSIPFRGNPISASDRYALTAH